jgi:hypothetical protein
MKTLHIFTEEVSAKNVFEALLPKIIPDDVFFRIYPHQGKRDLEIALQKSLPTLSKIPNSVILITRDQDCSDCKEVKNRIQELIRNDCHCEHVIRIACKELEAWFLGDLLAVNQAYPRFKPDQYQNKAEFRNVDRITNPNKYLLKIIPEYSNRSTLPKLAVSEAISPFLDLTRNRSSSFNNTISAIKRIVGLLSC